MITTIAILIVATYLATYLYNFITGKHKTPETIKLKEQKKRRKQETELQRKADFHILPNNDYGISVREANTRSKLLSRLAGEHEDRNARKLCIAWLVPDNDLYVDYKNPIRVDIAGYEVGYLSEYYAIKLRKKLRKLDVDKEDSISCNALIIGGNNQYKRYGVRLSMDIFDDE
ncbi:MAG: hypothetical protein ACRC9O_09760 [Plesiomonas sp.]|uniref:hypothetical protein n=1 Tax=Plesiomonas sp. TaxID=2486279 RepID=UPI003F33FA2B